MYCNAEGSAAGAGARSGRVASDHLERLQADLCAPLRTRSRRRAHYRRLRGRAAKARRTHAARAVRVCVCEHFRIFDSNEVSRGGYLMLCCSKSIT